MAMTAVACYTGYQFAARYGETKSMGLWDWLMGKPDDGSSAPARRKKAVPAAKRTSVLHLEVGDVVSYEDVDYVVKNKISYDDEGWEWFDYLLVDSATDR